MWKWILLFFVIKVIVVTYGDNFDVTCGQMFEDPASTAGGTKASIAPWTVSIGRQSCQFGVIFRHKLLSHNSRHSDG